MCGWKVQFNAVYFDQQTSALLTVFASQFFFAIVVYFDQLLSAARTQKLVETFSTFFVIFGSQYGIAPANAGIFKVFTFFNGKR